MSERTYIHTLWKEVCEVLRDGPLGFGELLAKVKNRRAETRRRSCSAETLSKALKELQQANFVTRDIRTRKYRLSNLGNATITYPAITPQATSLGPRATPREFVDFLVNAFVHSLKTGGSNQPSLPNSFAEQVTTQVSQFANGRTLAIRKLWMDIMDTFTIDLSTVFTALMLMHVSYAVSLPSEQSTVMIRKAVSVWTQFKLQQIEQSLTSYLSHPEVLVAIDQALKERSFKENLASTPFEEVCRSLKRQKYL